MGGLPRRALLLGGGALGAGVAWGAMKYARRKVLSQRLDEFSYPPVEGAVLRDGSPAPGVNSSLFLGEKSFLVAFASWCPYCKAQHAELMKLAELLQRPIYGLNCNDKALDCARYLSKRGNPFSAIGFDPAGSFLSRVGARGVPCNLIIGPKLQVLWGKSESSLNFEEINDLMKI